MSRYHVPRQQNALLRLYQRRAETGERMPSLREAGALLGISHERVRQLNVKLCARGVIRIEAPRRGVRVRHEGNQGSTPT